MLPFDPVELTHIRCRAADLARMLNVSRQAVHLWIKHGKVTLGSDGMLDPKVAVKQLLANADPGRLRAKVLAPLTRDIGSLHQRLAAIEVANKTLATEKEQLAIQLSEVYSAFEIFQALVKRNIHMLADADDPGADVDALLDQAISEACDLLAEPAPSELGEGCMMRASGE